MIFNNRSTTDRDHYDDCEIVTYQLIEMPIGPTMSIEQYMYLAEQKKAEREAATQSRKDEYEKRLRLEKYLQLKEEFE